MAAQELGQGHAPIQQEVHQTPAATPEAPFLSPSAVGFEPVLNPRALSYAAFIPAIQALTVPTPEDRREALIADLWATHVKPDDRPMTDWSRRHPWYHSLQDVTLAAAMIQEGVPKISKNAQACFAQDLSVLTDGEAEMRQLLQAILDAGISESWGVNTQLPVELSRVYWAAVAPVIGYE